MNIKEFAETYHVHVRRDGCGDLIIPGRPRRTSRQEDRCHVYEHGDGIYGVYLRKPTKRHFTFAHRRLIAAGCSPKQTGDSDGTLLFDPTDKAQARAALREAGVARRKQLSPEQIEELRRSLAARRGKALEG